MEALEYASQEAAHKILARRLYNGDGINIAHVLCEYIQMRFTTLCGGLLPDYFMAQFTIFLMYQVEFTGAPRTE